MAEFEFDFTPYVVEALAKIDAMVEERLKEHFRQAFAAGKERGEYVGGEYWDDTDIPEDFEEWFVMYVERLKRDGVRAHKG